MKNLAMFLFLAFSCALLSSCRKYRKENALEKLQTEYPKAKISWITSEGINGPDWYVVVDTTNLRSWKIGFVCNGYSMEPL